MNTVTKLTRLIALLCLGLACNAHADDSPSVATHRIQPMNTDTQTTAFFYQKPMVLDREQHKGLRLKAANALFASKTPSVPLLAAEFAVACLEYPIVFAKGQDGQWMALALTALQAQANAFVDAQGRWNARYVPASVRRYPFILAEGADKELHLAADVASPQLGQEGEALFDDKGDPTELTKNVLQLLADFQNQAKQTDAMLKKLDDTGLLTSQNLQARLSDGRNAVVEGVWIVDEAKLRELPDDKVLAFFKSGELVALHAHMLSLRNLLPLLERSLPASNEKPGKPPRKSSKTKASGTQP